MGQSECKSNTVGKSQLCPYSNLKQESPEARAASSTRASSQGCLSFLGFLVPQFCFFVKADRIHLWATTQTHTCTLQKWTSCRVTVVSKFWSPVNEEAKAKQMAQKKASSSRCLGFFGCCVSTDRQICRLETSPRSRARFKRKGHRVQDAV